MKYLIPLTNQERKRRYNLCHRLRLRGISVDVDNHRINLPGQQDYDQLAGTTRRYVDALLNEYRYVIQFHIPVIDGSDSIKFRWKKPRIRPSPDRVV